MATLPIQRMETPDMEGRTVSGAYEKIEGHEKLCAERYEGIDDKLKAMGAQLSTINKTALALILALLGWMAMQVYALEPLRNAVQQAPSHAEMPSG